MATELPVEYESRVGIVSSSGMPPSTLLQYAMDKGADIDRLEKLMELQERWEANEARKEFVRAMSAFHGEPVSIQKGKLVSFTTRDGETTSYHHAELSDVTEAIGPAMAKHGLSFRWHVRQGEGQVVVTCVVEHERGHKEEVTLAAAPDSSGKKNAIQQVGSAITYLQRYTLLAIAGQSTKGADDDGADVGRAETDEERQGRERNASVLMDFASKVEEAVDLAELRKVKDEATAHWGKAPGSIPSEFFSVYNKRLRDIGVTKPKGDAA